jgi:hypothetical protein
MLLSFLFSRLKRIRPRFDFVNPDDWKKNFENGFFEFVGRVEKEQTLL